MFDMVPNRSWKIFQCFGKSIFNPTWILYRKYYEPNIKVTKCTKDLSVISNVTFSSQKPSLFTLYLSVSCFIRHFESIIYERLRKAFFTDFLSFFVHYSDFGKILSNSDQGNTSNQSLQTSYKLWLYLVVKLYAGWL